MVWGFENLFTLVLCTNSTIFFVFFLRMIAVQCLTVNTYVASGSRDPICIFALAALLGYDGALGVLFFMVILHVDWKKC